MSGCGSGVSGVSSGSVGSVGGIGSGEVAEDVRSQRRHEGAKMECVLEQSLIFILALILDLTVGDPPEGVDSFYPIVWISRLMSCLLYTSPSPLD